MKAEELMIGDWVQNQDGSIKGRIVNIDAYQNRVEFGAHTIDADFVYPIPLTEEILEKSGFEIDKNFKNSNYKKNVYILAGCVKWKDDVVFVDFTSEVEGNVLFLTSCKYVHKLQHLLKDLEIEKEIKNMERVYKCVPFDVELAKKIQSGEVKGKISDFEGIILYDYITEIENGCIIQQRSKDIPNAYGRNGQCLDNVNKDILYIFIELPEETQKHNFIVGDLVKIHCEGDQYDNKIGEVVDVFTNTLHVRVEALLFPYKINDVEFIAHGRVNNSVTGEATKHEFKPFEKVLARDNDSQEWTVDFYSHKINNMHICIGTVWTHQVIPYEGNEHLVGTTNNPKYLWES